VHERRRWPYRRRRRKKSQLYACHFEHHGDGQLSKIKLLYRHGLSSSTNTSFRFYVTPLTLIHLLLFFYYACLFIYLPFSKDVSCATALFPKEVCWHRASSKVAFKSASSKELPALPPPPPPLVVVVVVVVIVLVVVVASLMIVFGCCCCTKEVRIIHRGAAISHTNTQKKVRCEGKKKKKEKQRERRRLLHIFHILVCLAQHKQTRVQTK
jgi:hypothetical protein